MEKKMEFLPEQKKAIELRNRNILVSASAGSGKTAVLTERIITILLDEENPVDIDKIVIVTFTRAAAAEMRKRIADKLSMRLKTAKGKQAVHIKKQIALLPHAQITTIDSFCLHIIRNYFYKISLDPSFAIADENDNRLMMAEVCDEILEEKYKEASENFTDMVEHLVTGRDDSILSELIMKFYDVSDSHPWPEKWLESCRENFKECSVEEFDRMDFISRSGLLVHINNICSEECDKLKRAVELCSSDYIDRECDCRTDSDDSKLADIRSFLADEYNMINALAECKTYSEYKKKIDFVEFGRFPAKKLEGGYRIIKEMAQELRNDAKKNIVSLRDNYFSKPVSLLIEELGEYRNTVNELVNIAAEFRKRFSERKREENVIDFGDVEHLALKILYDSDEEGKRVRSEAAKELTDRYEYILIDEYQDSNEVQETILTAISREEAGRKNMFMVGDIKQSIYGFRLAKPDIFEHKRSTYSDDDSDDQRIILGRNFRSEPKILAAVNYLFSGIMDKKTGGVTYDKEHMFAVDEEELSKGEAVEVIYIADSEEEVSEEISDYGKHEIEASVIAERIRQITDPVTGLKIYDKSIQSERVAEYGDIVILLRSMSGWAEDFVETLTFNGIPAVAEEKSGYFSAYEIQIVLAMLKIIDNPHQDIPLAAALKSVYGDMNDSELAAIRLHGDEGMYEALLAASCNCEQENLKNKCTAFLEILESFRQKAPYMKVYDIVNELMSTREFAAHMRAMPAGERRYGNLRMLLDKAAEYDKRSGSHNDIFGFLKSIDRLKKADIDFGESKITHGDGSTVSIMSIHKSKGLEFPVVFVAGMGKGFNFMDIHGRFPIHSEIGPAPDVYDYKKRTRKKTLIKKAVAQKMHRDMIGEELRIMYVAMTRPECKLIMTGYVKDCEEFFDSCRKKGNSYSSMLSAKATYYSIITPRLLEYEGDLFDIKVKRLSELLIDNGDGAIAMLERKSILGKTESNKELLGEINEIIAEQVNYHYPYENETHFPMKVSVSEIKHKNAVIEDEMEVKASWVTDETREYIPEFMQDKEKKLVSGADRGTVYHSLLEHLELEHAGNREQVNEQIKELVGKGKLPEEALQNNIINADKIVTFCGSTIADRMRKAGKQGKLYREQPFVMGVPGSMVFPETESEETIIVQGIIDVFFEEEDALVLLDYKTDRLLTGEENKLVKRYRAQMECYKMAMEKAYNKPVKEIILYSFALDKPVNVG